MIYSQPFQNLTQYQCPAEYHNMQSYSSLRSSTHLGVTVVDHSAFVTKFTGADTLGAGGQWDDFRRARVVRSLYDARQESPLFTGYRFALVRQPVEFLQTQPGYPVSEVFGPLWDENIIYLIIIIYLRYMYHILFRNIRYRVLQTHYILINKKLYV